MLTIVCRGNPNAANKLVSSTIMHLFCKAFMENENELVLVALFRQEAVRVANENKLVLAALFRQEAVREAKEQVEREAVEREAVQEEPQICSSIDKLKTHVVHQSMSSNSTELKILMVSAHRNPQQGDWYLAPTQGTTRTITTTTSISALPTQDLGQKRPHQGRKVQGMEQKTMLSVGRNITIQF